MRILAILLGILAGSISGLYGVVLLLGSDSFWTPSPSAPLPQRIVESNERKIDVRPAPTPEPLVVPKLAEETKPPLQTENAALATAPSVARDEATWPPATRPLPPPKQTASKRRVAKYKQYREPRITSREGPFGTYDEPTITYRVTRPSFGFFGNDW
jgi:hypothetical protein